MPVVRRTKEDFGISDSPEEETLKEESKKEKPVEVTEKTSETKREELKTIRTGQMTPVTKKRLEKRLEEGPQKKAISGRKIPQKKFKTKAKPPTTLEPLTEPGINLDGDELQGHYEQYVPKIEDGPIAKAIRKEEQFFGKVTEPYMELYESSLEKSQELASEGTPWAGFGYYALGQTARFGKGVIEGASFFVRPGVWASPFLAITPEGRKAIMEAAARDPVGVVVEAAGGFTGGYIVSKAPSMIKKAKGYYEQKKYLTDLPDEAFLHPDEAATAFPEEVTIQREASTLFQKKTVQVYDTTKGEPGFFDYYGYDPSKLPDESVRVTPAPDVSPQRVLWDIKGEKMSIPIDQGPPLKVTEPGVSITKPGKGLLYRLGDEFGLVRTGHDLIPAIIPEGLGTPTTIPVPWIETITSHVPGARFITPSPSGIGPSTSWLSLTSGLAGGLTTIRPKEPTVDKPLPSLRGKPDETVLPNLDENIKQVATPHQRLRRDRPEPTLEDPLLESEPIIMPMHGIEFMPMQEPIPEQKSKVINMPVTKLDFMPIQEPIETPKPPQEPPIPFLFPAYEEPPQPKKLRLPFKEEKAPKGSPMFPDIFGFGKKVTPVASPEDSMAGILGLRRKKKK